MEENREIEQVMAEDAEEIDVQPEESEDTDAPSEAAEERREPKNRLEAYVMHTMRRTKVMHIIAGAYIAYLGYQLISGFIDGAEGASVPFLIAGILFVIVGIGMAALGLYGVTKENPEEKQ